MNGHMECHNNNNQQKNKTKPSINDKQWKKNAFVPYHILFQRGMMQPVESANFNVYLKFCIA